MPLEVREQALLEAALLFQAERLMIQAEAAALVEAERLDKKDYKVQADAMRTLMAARAADRTSSSRRQFQSIFDQAAVGGCGVSSKGPHSRVDGVLPRRPAPEPVHGPFGISTPRS